MAKASRSRKQGREQYSPTGARNRQVDVARSRALECPTYSPRFRGGGDHGDFQDSGFGGSGVLLWTFRRRRPRAAGRSQPSSRRRRSWAQSRRAGGSRRPRRGGLRPRACGLFGRATREAPQVAGLARAGGDDLDADAARALRRRGAARSETASKPKPPTPPTSGGAEPGSGILRDKYILGLAKALKAEQSAGIHGQARDSEATCRPRSISAANPSFIPNAMTKPIGR